MAFEVSTKLRRHVSSCFFFFFNLAVVFQSLCHVRLFAIPWTAAHQAPLPFTISQSLLRFMSIDLVMPFGYLILCHPFLLLPSVVSSESGLSCGMQDLVPWPGIGPRTSALGVWSLNH